ncbi:MAG: hypothetical protein RLO80_02475 [Hyphomonas sp.]
MIRRIAAGLLALIAAWLLWQGIVPVQMIVSRGSPLEDALLQPPTSLWRIVAAAITLIGAALATFNIRGGGWLAGVGVILFAALPAVMAGMGSSSSLWRADAMTAAVLVALAGVLAFVKRS